jgi:thiol-disulfide isomerase/thioredoxin
MKEITLKEAEALAKELTDKVKLFVFGGPGCTTCANFKPVVEEVCQIAEFKDHVEAYYIHDPISQQMLFPPTISPTTYVYIPNCPDPQPIYRTGLAPFDALKQELEKWIEAKDTGKHLWEVYGERVVE